MSRKWLNKNDEMYIKIREIVNQYDPIGILFGYEDEYEREIVEILNRCTHENNFMRFKSIVVDIFKFWFAPLSFDDELMTEMCDEIYRYLNGIE